VHHFKAYPRRYAWSARTRSARRRATNGNGTGSMSVGSVGGGGSNMSHSHQPLHVSGYPNHYDGNNNNDNGNNGNRVGHLGGVSATNSRDIEGQSNTMMDSNVSNSYSSHGQQIRTMYSEPNDEIVISAAMQQLRQHGVLIVAHGSRGRPKTVRLQLTENAITWRTETRKKPNPPKLGKLHQVPLAHIMYVDVGKQTTALRRVENAGVPESLCFSLLTKEGSLDLEANSPRERDALVGCFSLVLDEVHAAQNWRDIYRGPSSDMPSSFDDFENEEVQQQGI